MRAGRGDDRSSPGRRLRASILHLGASLRTLKWLTLSSVTHAVVELAAITTECVTAEEYASARTHWLHATVDCDAIYQGAVSPSRPLRPVVSGVDPARTAACEAGGYWDDRHRLNIAARRAGGVAVDHDVLSARERRERPFYRDVVAGLGLRTNMVAVLELRGQPVSCIYFSWSAGQRRCQTEVEHLRAALAVLALGEAVHRSAEAPSPDLGLTKREDEILGYIVRGLTNLEIATLLGTAPSTVKNQVATILRKTGAANRTELAWHTARQATPPRCPRT